MNIHVSKTTVIIMSGDFMGDHITKSELNTFETMLIWKLVAVLFTVCVIAWLL